MNGLLRCSRYSFGPNRLHYCGPDANSEILGYINNNFSDPGLESILGKFRTLFPYLKLIAESNGVPDPFDDKVVEAYWLGNGFLENVGKKRLYESLIDEHLLKKKLPKKDFDGLADKIAGNALPHHSFHVLNVWLRTGNDERAHTLESMDSCRIAWGKILEIDGPKIVVEYAPLVLRGGKLASGKLAKKTLTRSLESESDLENLAPGKIISFHWNVPCETITPLQEKNLKKYTLQSIRLANLTI